MKKNKKIIVVIITAFAILGSIDLQEIPTMSNVNPHFSKMVVKQNEK